MLTSGLLAGCTQKTKPDTKLEEFRNRLVESRQKKLMQLEQVEMELAELQTEIHEIESELASPLPLKAAHNLTTEEIAASFAGPGLMARLAQLQEQEQSLVATKHTLEQDIEELEQLLRWD